MNLDPKACFNCPTGKCELLLLVCGHDERHQAHFTIELKVDGARLSTTLYYTAVLWFEFSYLKNEVFPSSVPEFCKMTENNILGSVRTHGKLRDVQFYRFLTPGSF